MWIAQEATTTTTTTGVQPQVGLYGSPVPGTPSPPGTPGKIDRPRPRCGFCSEGEGGGKGFLCVLCFLLITFLSLRISERLLARTRLGK